MPFFDTSNKIVATLEPRYNADGTIDRQAKAHGDLTAKTPYFLTYNKEGPVTAAVASGVANVRIIVPRTAVSSDDVFWGQTGGYITSVVTPSIDIDSGDGWEITSGAIADSGAYAKEADEFAISVVDDAGSAATTHNMFLFDREITTPS